MTEHRGLRVLTGEVATTRVRPTVLTASGTTPHAPTAAARCGGFPVFDGTAIFSARYAQDETKGPTRVAGRGVDGC